MYKIFLFSLTLLFVACSTHSSPTTTNREKVENNNSSPLVDLKKALDAYTQATIDNDVPKLINFIYPKVFTVVPKKKMTEVLTKAYQSQHAPKVDHVKHLKIDPIKSYKEGMFTIVTSSMRTTLKSPNPNDFKFESYMLNVIKKGLKGRGSVEFDKEKHTYSIQHVSRTLAINEGGEWKFAGLKQAKKYAQKGLLNSVVVDAIHQQ